MVHPGETLSGTLASGEERRLSLTLDAGTSVEVTLEQRGLLLAITVTSPGGVRLLRLGNSRLPEQPLAFPLPAGAGGTYSLAVRNLAAGLPAGSFHLAVSAAAPETARDRDGFAATAVWARAEEGSGRLGDRVEPGGRERAIAAYAESAAAWAALGDGESSVRATVRQGAEQLRSGAREEAATTLRRALAAAREGGDLAGQSAALHQLGELAHQGGQATVARAAFDEAIALRRAARDLAGEARTELMRGQVLVREGAVDEGVAAYQRALDLARQGGDPQAEEAAQHNLGSVGLLVGDSEGALDHFAAALALQRRIGSRANPAVTLSLMADVYRRLGEPARAVELQRASLAERRRADDRRGEGYSRASLGEALLDRGELAAAAAECRQAERMLAAIGDPVGEALALHCRARCFRRRGEPAEAAASLADAVTLARRAGNVRLEASSLAEMGWARLAGGAVDEAEGPLRSALALARRIDNAVVEARALAGLAALAERRGELDAALDDAMQGIARIEGLRTAIAEPGLRATYLATQADLFELAVDVQMRRAAAGDSEGAAAALLLHERSRARSLVDALERIRPAAMAIAAPPPLTVTQLQALLDSDTVLLELALGERRSFGWAVTSTAVVARELPPRAALERRARRLRELLEAEEPHLVARPLAWALADLARLVLAPFRDEIAGRRLVLAPDGALQLVPFAALPDPGAPPGTPLVARHELVLVPSATALAALRAGVPASGSPQRVAVLADPVFSAEDPRVGHGDGGGDLRGGGEPRSALLPRRLSRLRGSRDEAESILALVPPQGRVAAFGLAVTPELLRSPALRGVDVLHLATHAVADPAHPERSGLALSLVGADGAPRAGWLRLADLYGLSLDADLVVLSACDTAVGSDLRGEGVAALARGFFYAGARRVVASLWPVRDDATAELMRRFYAGLLRERLPPAAALRAAQRALAADPRWRQPRDWAAFELQGDWQ